MRMLSLFGGMALGIIITLFAVSFLFGAPHRMVSSSDRFARHGVYYVVGEMRFDYLNRGLDAANCWGGHTLDGRCISAVYVLGEK
jgi:hypothetical protein